jgi:hypothetical protein
LQEASEIESLAANFSYQNSQEVIEKISSLHPLDQQYVFAKIINNLGFSAQDTEMMKNMIIYGTNIDPEYREDFAIVKKLIAQIYPAETSGQTTDDLKSLYSDVAIQLNGGIRLVAKELFDVVDIGNQNIDYEKLNILKSKYFPLSQQNALIMESCLEQFIEKQEAEIQPEVKTLYEEITNLTKNYISEYCGATIKSELPKPRSSKRLSTFFGDTVANLLDPSQASTRGGSHSKGTDDGR